MTIEKFKEVQNIYEKLRHYEGVLCKLKDCVNLYFEISTPTGRFPCPLDEEIIPIIGDYYMNKVEEYRKLMNEA